MNSPCDLLIENVNIASMQDNDSSYGEIRNAAVAIQDGTIFWVGASNDHGIKAHQVIDGKNGWITPGLIDCHTHLVFAGDRAQEFEMRQQGVSYAEIAQQGGGIKSTVKATREASETDLLKSAIHRAKRLINEGVTTLEVKSGYGLDDETECKMLRVARDLSNHLDATVVTTYLGAHTVPVEYKDASDDYVRFICDDMLPKIAREKLADAVDVFCESIGFSPTQCEQIFSTAKQHGLAVKAHAEQLSDLKGALLAARYNALSVDHIEFLAESDLPEIASSGAVAVLLPGAYYYLRETKLPPVEGLRQHNIPIALASDLNPGSSPIASLLTIMNMGCVLFNLTPEEALKGVTLHAAKALGLSNKGIIKAGADADLCLWRIAHPAELSYGINLHTPEVIVQAGEVRQNVQ